MKCERIKIKCLFCSFVKIYISRIYAETKSSSKTKSSSDTFFCPSV